jgi:hypothetical protein
VTSLSHLSAWLAGKEGQAFLQALQIFATVLALVVGGVWTWMLFVRRRQRYPRADLRQSLAHWRLPDGRILLRISLVVENRGEILLSLAEGFVRVQRMLPWSEEDLVALETSDPRTREVAWHLVEERPLQFARREFEIEPGEKEQLDVDFLVDPEVERVVVYSYLRNRVKRRRDIGWSVTSVYPTGEATMSGGMDSGRDGGGTR